MEKLFEIFPNIDKDAIRFIYEKNKKNLDKTAEELSSNESFTSKQEEGKKDIEFLRDLFDFDIKIIEKEYKDNKNNLDRTMETLMSLKLIKDEENLLKNENTEKTKTNEDKINEKINDKINELHKMFPKFDKDQIYAVFLVCNQDVNQTFDRLEYELKKKPKKDKKKVIPVVSTIEKGEKNVFSKEMLGQVKKVKEEDGWQVVPQHKEYKPRLTINKSAEEYREEANKFAKDRNYYFKMAAEAFRRGDGKTAKEYSEKGKELDKDMKNSHEKAFLALKNRNDDSYNNVLDLHGFFENEAIRILEEKLKTTKRIEVITGIGKHSTKGPVLKNAIEKYCREKGLRSKEISDGILQVRKN